MSEMVHAALAGDIAEAEEMQEILRNAGIDSSLEQSLDDDGVRVLASRMRRKPSRRSRTLTI